MKTKNLFKLFFVGGAAALAVLSCSTKEQAVKGYNVADFAVDVTSTTATTATAKVTVTNNDAAPWYAFATTDLDSKAADLIAAELEELEVSTKILNTGSKDVTLSGLVPGGVHYRVIVTGLAPDGRSYGTPAEAEFRSGADFSENAAWNVQYAGTAVEDGEQVNYFAVSGTAADESFSYIVVPASDFAELGVAEIVSADVEAILAADAAADATFSGDDYYTWDELDPGDYVFVMYGVEEPFNPTLQYALGEFTIEGPSDLYNAYLGNWYNEEGDVFVVEENVINQSFYFNGMPAYLTADGSIEIPFDTTEDGNYILGIGSDDDLWDGYPLATGSINEEGDLVMQGATVEYKGELIDIVGIGIFAYDGRSFVPVGTILGLPSTLTKTEPQPTEEYSAWIGTWYTDGGDQFEIKAGIVNKTFLMSGFYPEMDVKLVFDEASGAVQFFDQSIRKDSDGTYYFTGQDTAGYLEDAEQAPVSGLLATATMASDGESFDVEGNVFDAVYGGTPYPNTTIGKLLVIIYSAADGKPYGLRNAIEVDLPGSFYDKIPEPSEEYLAWVGDWTVVRGTGASATEDTWTIAEKKVNSEYTVTGIEGTSFKLTGSFDKASGAFSIPEQTVYEVSDENGDTFMSIELMGTIVYQRQTLPVGAGAIPFSAILDESGNVTVSAGYYAGYYKFNGFRLFGLMLASESVAAYSEVGYSIPFTMTAAEEPSEGTSVNSLSFPVRPEQWTATDLQRLPGANGISTNSVDGKQAKVKQGKTLTKEKKSREFKGDLSKVGKGKINYGGGKRGKLNK